MRGLPLSINEYIDVLKIVAQTNALGKLFTVNFSETSLQDKLYIFISAAFYLFSIYQNAMVCIRFNENMKTIHNHFKEIKLYLKSTINTMDNYLTYADSLSTHEQFNATLKSKKQVLETIYNKIETVTEYSLYNVRKITEIGKVLKYFYELHTNSIYDDAIMYSIGFNGYIDCLKGLQNNIVERNKFCKIY
jgi:hypothetical protein